MFDMVLCSPRWLLLRLFSGKFSERLKDLLPNKDSDQGRVADNNRLLLEAILWKVGLARLGVTCPKR